MKSEQLKAVFTDAGLANVQTVTASGNVIFEAKEKDEEKLKAKLEKAMKDALGFEVITFIRSEAELESILDENPFKEAKEGHGYISFLSGVPGEAAVKEIEERSSDTEILKIQGRELYMLFHVRMSDSVFFKKPDYEKVLGVLATNRNLNTPVKILAKMKKG